LYYKIYLCVVEKLLFIPLILEKWCESYRETYFVGNPTRYLLEKITYGFLFGLRFYNFPK